LRRNQALENLGWAELVKTDQTNALVVPLLSAN
jgi:hypothetical protein